MPDFYFGRDIGQVGSAPSLVGIATSRS